MNQPLAAPSPRQQAKRHRILEAALKVFSKEGYTGASMDAIALEAQVSKPTLYMYFGGKEQLFEAIMHAALDFMLEPFSQPTGDMVRDLHNFAWHYADIVMNPDYLSLARLVIGEAQRFPDIGRAYQAAGPDRTLAGMMAFLNRMRGQRRLSFADAELAAQDLWALILSAPRNQALHIPDMRPTRREIKRYIDNGLKVFLAAYSTHAPDDIRALNEIVAEQQDWGEGTE